MAGNEGSVSSLSSPEDAQWAAVYRDEKQVPNATAETLFSIAIQREKLLLSSESYLHGFFSF